MTAQAPRGLGRIFDLVSKPNDQRKIDSNDSAFRQMQAKIGRGAAARQISNLAITTAKLNIPHKLGAPVKGWRVVDISATGVTIKKTASPDESKWLCLQGSGTATISIEVWVLLVVFGPSLLSSGWV